MPVCNQSTVLYGSRRSKRKPVFCPIRLQSRHSRRGAFCLILRPVCIGSLTIRSCLCRFSGTCDFALAGDHIYAFLSHPAAPRLLRREQHRAKRSKQDDTAVLYLHGSDGATVDAIATVIGKIGVRCFAALCPAPPSSTPPAVNTTESTAEVHLCSVYMVVTMHPWASCPHSSGTIDVRIFCRSLPCCTQQHPASSAASSTE